MDVDEKCMVAPSFSLLQPDEKICFSSLATKKKKELNRVPSESLNKSG